MKYFILLLVIAFSTTSYSQWQLQNSGTAENLNDVAILNQTAAIVVGDNGIILKTSNNGNEWNPIKSGTINKLNVVSFSMMGEGVAVGDGVICLSTDQGENWTATYIYINKNAISVSSFYSEFWGWNILIGCDDGTILYYGVTYNAWQDTVLTNEPIIATGMTDLGLHVSPTSFATNLFTANTLLPIHPASTWKIYNNPLNPGDSLRCGVLNRRYQYLVGNGGSSGSEILTLKKYFFNDTLWVPTYSFISSPFIPEDISIYYDYDLFICGSDGKIFTSIDDGASWSEQITGIVTKLNAISFRSDSIGYSVGDSGTILFTSNGGGINSVNEIKQPNEIVLYQNYPNPFNPITNIEYKINSRQHVQLKVFDVLGNEITTLVNEEQPAGSNNAEFDPSLISSTPSSGIYFYQLSTTGKEGHSVQTMKMIYLK
jgi:hypothetical protein